MVCIRKGDVLHSQEVMQNMSYVCTRWRNLLYGALMVMVGFVASSTMAEDTELHQVVDGIAIYFGVLPTEMIRGHPKAHPESQMHGGIPTDRRYHLTVAIFEDSSGERITNAKVTVNVVGSRGNVVRKALEAMTIAGTRSYGNYIMMPGAGPYRIEVQIRRLESPTITRAIFDWGRT
jgi:hypothetical protein